MVRVVGALLLEQNDEWPVQRARYMTLETIAPLGDGSEQAIDRADRPETRVDGSPRKLAGTAPGIDAD